MAFVDLVETEFIRTFLGINEDDETFDEEISIAIPFYAARLQKLVNVDFEKLSTDDQTYLSEVVASMIGCHLMKSDGSFGAKYAGWKVGDTAKYFDKRTQKPYDTWCEMMDDLLAELASMFGDPQGDASSTPRISIEDTYTTFY